MTEAARVIHVEPDSELGQLLDEVVESETVLEKEGVHYQISRVGTSAEMPEGRRRLQPERVLEIIGIGESSEETNIARFKDEYIADAVDHRGQ